MRKKFWFILLQLSVFTAAADVVLIDSGVPQSHIELGSSASETEQYAASELSRILEKMSGATISCKSGGGTSIVFGTPVSHELVGQNAHRLGLHGDKNRIAIAAIDDKIFLCGTTPSNVLYSVYTFLHSLGARWFWPGTEGEFLPELPTVIVKDNFQIVESPSLRMRGLHIMGIDQETEIWMARNRMNYIRSSSNNPKSTIDFRRKLGFLITTAGHSVAPSKDDFAQHPDWYAMVSGKRRTDLPRAHVCWSNPEVKEYFANRAIKDLNALDVDVYQLYSTDSGTYCECPQCSRQDPSTAWHTFLADIVDRIRSEHQCDGIGTLAYAGYRSVPKCRVDYLDYLEFCMHGRCYRHTFADKCPVNNEELKRLRKWLATGVPVTVRGYELDVFLPPLPLVFSYIMSDQIKTFHGLGVDGYFTEADRYPRGKTQAFRFTLYALSRFMWNKDEPPAQILDDWCDRIFGPAASFLREFYMELEKAWQDMPGHISYYSHNPGPASVKFINEEMIARVDSLFQKAENAIEPLPQKEKKRLAKQIDFERNRFSEWTVLYRKFAAVQGDNTSMVIPQNYFTSAPGKFPDAAENARAAIFPTFKDRFGKPATNRTDVRAFHNGESFFLDVSCFDSNMESVRHDCEVRDGAVYSDESLEIFIRVPDQTPGEYYHLAVNSSAVRYDAISRGAGNSDASWNPDWSGVIRREEDKWRCLIELPFSEFGGKPVKGAGWFFTINHTKGKRTDIQHSGFPLAAFHNPDAFGQLTFSKEKKPILLIYRPATSNTSIITEIAEHGFSPVELQSEGDLPRYLTDNAAMLLLGGTSQRHIPGKLVFKKHISTWVQQGGIVVISAGCQLTPEVWFEDSRLKIKRHSGMLPVEASDISPGDWASHRNDLTDNFKRRVTDGAFSLEHPDAWHSLAYSRSPDDKRLPWLFATKYGKGWLVITTAGLGGRGGVRAFCSKAEAAAALLANLAVSLPE